jgi:hypothetical protein
MHEHMGMCLSRIRQAGYGHLEFEGRCQKEEYASKLLARTNGTKQIKTATFKQWAHAARKLGGKLKALTTIPFEQLPLHTVHAWVLQGSVQTWFLDSPVCRANSCLSASLGYLEKETARQTMRGRNRA